MQKPKMEKPEILKIKMAIMKKKNIILSQRPGAVFNIEAQENSRPPGLEEDTFFPQERVLSSIVVIDLKFDKKKKK